MAQNPRKMQVSGPRPPKPLGKMQVSSQEVHFATLGPSWGPLWPSWGPLGLSWGPLGPSWGPLGSLLGRLGAILGASEVVKNGTKTTTHKMLKMCALRSDWDDL